MLFGLFGTIFTFIMFSGLTYGFMKSGIMYKYVKEGKVVNGTVVE